MRSAPASYGLGGIVQDIAAAITRQENVNPAYNNPGGLIAAPGCTSRPGQIATCPDPETGQAGLERQVQIDINRGWTLSDLIGSWAPKCNLPICKGNDPATYTAHVSSWTGIDPNVPLNQLSEGSAAPDSGGMDTSGADLAGVLGADSGSNPALVAVLVILGVGLAWRVLS